MIRIMSKWIEQSDKDRKHQRIEIKLPDGSVQKMLYSRFVVERILGKTLPRKAVVHHVDGDSLYDYPGNLVVCENQAYHLLLHLRAKALKATGNPNSRRCWYCKQWGIIGEGDLVNYIKKNRSQTSGTGTVVHRSCARKHAR